VSLGKPIDIKAPCYPQAANADNISGQVQVKFVVDEEGKVIWARAINGHPMLQHAAVNAACRSRFTPSTLLGSKMKVNAIGVITYVFKLP
jgi:TonB family protein